MFPLFSVIGPTATGKTACAWELARTFAPRFSRIDLISVDSRQVYQGLEIGTGVDLPPECVPQVSTRGWRFFQFENIAWHGISLVRPDQEWSVTQFRNYAQQIIEESLYEGGFPILVGGTGLYHHHVLNTDPTLEVPPNLELRLKAAAMTTPELQQWLNMLNTAHFNQLNQSDRYNSRRLIRAIEVELAQKADATKDGTEARTQDFSHASYKSGSPLADCQQFYVGLSLSVEELHDRIAQRVQARLDRGMIAEVEQLIATYDQRDWQTCPAFSATGYKEVRQFLSGVLTETQMKELWIRHETQYAKRQLTWWKKQQNVMWFSVSEPYWQSDVQLYIERKL